jgi:hypothetical protein
VLQIAGRVYRIMREFSRPGAAASVILEMGKPRERALEK